MAIAAGLVLLVVAAAVAAVLLRGERGPATFPEGLPERAFQRYYQAFLDRDFEAAYGYFSQRVQRQASPDAYVRLATSASSHGVGADARVRVDRVDQRDGRATLYLAVDHFTDDGLTGGRFTEERQVPLVQEAGQWKIDEPLLGIDPAPLPLAAP
ncbi:MAG: hypothetical protein IRY97_01400 [Thermomicrobiaceae bacterium]|nr:hypothetical protein [Thermomicrobiaceae bacterium]